MPVVGTIKERRSYRCAVTGEAAIQRQHGNGLILPDTVEITYQRDSSRPWHVRIVKVEGTRPLKNGRPSQQFIDETWYVNPNTPQVDPTRDLPAWLLAHVAWHQPATTDGPIPEFEIINLEA